MNYNNKGLNSLKNISIHQISSALAIFFFGIFIAIKLYNKEEIILADAIVLGLAAGMLPVAFFLIIFPFTPNLDLGDLKKLSLQIAIGGLVLFYIYGKTILEILCMH